MSRNLITPYDIIHYDGSLGLAFAYYAQPKTIPGTVWRFLLSPDQTLVVTPFQTPNSPAPDLHGVPNRIESVLGGYFEWVVGFAAQDPHLPDWEREIQEAIELELLEWRENHPLPALDEYERERKKAHKRRAQEWIKAGVPDEIPKAMDEAEWLARRRWITDQIFAGLESSKIRAKKDRARLDKRRNEIEKKYRRRFSKRRAERLKMAEVEVLWELNDFLGKFSDGSPVDVPKPSRATQQYSKSAINRIVNTFSDIDTPGVRILSELRDFIRKTCRSGERKTVVVREANLLDVLKKIKELTGQEIREQVFLESQPWMRKHVEEWASEISRVEKIDVAKARKRVLEDVKFVAEFADGFRYLIRSISVCSPHKEEVFLWSQIEPSEDEWAEIETKRNREQAKVEETTYAPPSGGLLRNEPRRLGRTWQVMTIFNLTDNEFRVHKKGFRKINGKWDIDFIVDEKGFVPQRDANDIRDILNATSTAALIEARPDLEKFIKTSA